jgi:hypothetical protein
MVKTRLDKCSGDSNRNVNGNGCHLVKISQHNVTLLIIRNKEQQVALEEATHLSCKQHVNFQSV